MDRSLQCRLTVNIEAGEAAVDGHSSLYRCHRRVMWQNQQQQGCGQGQNRAPDQCIQHIQTTGGQTPGATQCRSSIILLQPMPSRPSRSMPAPAPSLAVPPFLQGPHPTIQGQQPHVALVLLSPEGKASVDHRLAFPRSSICLPPLLTPVEAERY